MKINVEHLSLRHFQEHLLFGVFPSSPMVVSSFSLLCILCCKWWDSSRFLLNFPPSVHLCNFLYYKSLDHLPEVDGHKLCSQPRLCWAPPTPTWFRTIENSIRSSPVPVSVSASYPGQKCARCTETLISCPPTQSLPLTRVFSGWPTPSLICSSTHCLILISIL